MKMTDAVRLLMTTHLSDRDIGIAAGTSKTTVGRYRHLIEAKRFTWEHLSALDPDALRALLNRPTHGGIVKRIPDFALLHQQLQGKGASLQLWWESYRRENPHDALSYSCVASKLKAFRAKLPTVMRQHHVPGERVFVDYSGDRPSYLDPSTRERVRVELFVGVLPASSLTFALCTRTQTVPDFIRAHVAMLTYFGGAPQIVVPDNLKSAVTKTGPSPVIQHTYADLARHYGMAVIPARPYRPRDKAAVESAVKVAQQRILRRLQHLHLFSLEELNEAVAKLLVELNDRPMSKDGSSRQARFDILERKALKPLPAQPFECCESVSIPKVPRDYHVNVAGHFYSVPHALVGEKVNARLTDQQVEILHQRRCVAVHPRSRVRGSHTTDPKHQTDPHRAYADRTEEGLKAWAKTAGASIARFVLHQFDRPQPCHGLTACDTLRRLAVKHGTAPVDEAVRSSFELRTPTISIVKRLLENAAHPSRRQAIPAPRSSYAKGAAHYAEAVPC